ncbi:chromosome partition protein smc [Acetivibrio straminisolvens JCM 21531]|uniref:Chromosome partition protein smc n=1 Tax=Acetivibrio straminisolvens JCM 21531 TaxID=1294263 RepID=W4V745_9FIRM|nr:hypothetical protein [Acetivibrio straminisolvens]GAE89225.1 chromosome partition protein smc [Acetivibrio straminisolvens JCM 21531]
MARRFGYSFRIVSLDGDILSTTGSMSGGSKEKRESGILSRNREISELEKNIAELKEDDGTIEKNVETLSRELTEIIDKISLEESSLKDNELIKIRDESHLAQIEENIKRSIARIDMLKQEKEQLIRQEKDTFEELSKYENELSKIEGDIAEKKKYCGKISGEEQGRAVDKRCVAYRHYRLQNFGKLYFGEYRRRKRNAGEARE